MLALLLTDCVNEKIKFWLHTNKLPEIDHIDHMRCNILPHIYRGRVTQVGLNLRKGNVCIAQAEKGTARFRDVWEVRGCGISLLLEQCFPVVGQSLVVYLQCASTRPAHHYGCALCRQ
jgi:hypothetical protein